MHPITSLTDYEKNRIAGDTELFPTLETRSRMKECVLPAAHC